MLLKIIALVILTPLVLTAIFTFYRKSQYPEKTLFNSFLNVILTPMRIFKLGPYKYGMPTLEKAMKYAVKKTKCSDFGDKTFLDAYNAIFNTPIHRSLRLTNIGFIMYQIELNQTMYRRATFIQYLKDCPEILNIPVRSPVFVLGLPRTGTTFLHRLLSLDPKVRAPLLWELLSPVPKLRGESSEEFFRDDCKKRAKAMRALVKQRQSMGDNSLQHIHEIDPDLPEECIMGLTDELPIHLSCLYSDYLNYELFFAQNCGKPVVNAYSHYKKLLQLLSHQIGEGKNPRRWVLKCPIHLFYIKEIAQVFPDAKIIWTHRHPVSAVPSLCSLVKSLHQVYYENYTRNDKLIGTKINEISQKVLIDATKDIKTSGLESTNVIYENLVANPIQTVQEIYKQYGWEFTQEYENILKKYLEENRLKREMQKKEKQGVLHTYTPEEFSLTAEELCVGPYEQYCKQYNVPMSRN